MAPTAAQLPASMAGHAWCAGSLSARPPCPCPQTGAASCRCSLGRMRVRTGSGAVPKAADSVSKFARGVLTPIVLHDPPHEPRHLPPSPSLCSSTLLQSPLPTPWWRLPTASSRPGNAPRPAQSLPRPRQSPSGPAPAPSPLSRLTWRTPSTGRTGPKTRATWRGSRMGSGRWRRSRQGGQRWRQQRPSCPRRWQAATTPSYIASALDNPPRILSCSEME